MENDTWKIQIGCALPAPLEKLLEFGFRIDLNRV